MQAIFTHRTGVVFIVATALSVAACAASDERAAESTASTITTTTSIPAESSEGAVPITPGQPEGPYYPVIKPADRDHDLTMVAGSSGSPEGEVLALDGLLIYSDGSPVANATIEIWQTDANGVYLHPDFAEDTTDPAFQYYGETVTDDAGEWNFRTVLPVAYESRPPHIHAKVRVDGEEALTTQIYFSRDGADSGTAEALLVAEVFASPVGFDADLVASHVIVLSG